jgi:hypothetical protein
LIILAFPAEDIYAVLVGSGVHAGMSVILNLYRSEKGVANAHSIFHVGDGQLQPKLILCGADGYNQMVNWSIRLWEGLGIYTYY